MLRLKFAQVGLRRYHVLSRLLRFGAQCSDRLVEVRNIVTSGITLSGDRVECLLEFGHRRFPTDERCPIAVPFELAVDRVDLGL